MNSLLATNIDIMILHGGNHGGRLTLRGSGGESSRPGWRNGHNDDSLKIIYLATTFVADQSRNLLQDQVTMTLNYLKE
jgi:hypothetical protein